MPDLTHLTSTTGHLARTSRSEVADDVIEILRPLVEAEGSQVPHTPEWYLDVWGPLDYPDRNPRPGCAVFQVAPGPATSGAGKRP